MAEQKHIVAQPIHKSKSKRNSNRSIWASVCYYYPQYTLETASKLSVRDINLLMDTANKLEAQKMYMLTQIVASPHTKKGVGVKQLTNTFKRIMEK